jgi:hypothetical protein
MCLSVCLSVCLHVCVRVCVCVQYYDMAAVFSGFAAGPAPLPARGGGWEAGASAFAARRASAPLLRLWLATLAEQWAPMGLGACSSGDQQGM